MRIHYAHGLSAQGDRVNWSTAGRSAGEAHHDGRIRHWSGVTLSGESSPRILRVVSLEDGATIHNTFLNAPSAETREIGSGLQIAQDAFIAALRMRRSEDEA